MLVQLNGLNFTTKLPNHRIPLLTFRERMIFATKVASDGKNSFWAETELGAVGLFIEIPFSAV